MSFLPHKIFAKPFVFGIIYLLSLPCFYLGCFLADSNNQSAKQRDTVIRNAYPTAHVLDNMPIICRVVCLQLQSPHLSHELAKKTELLFKDTTCAFKLKSSQEYVSSALFFRLYCHSSFVFLPRDNSLSARETLFSLSYIPLIFQFHSTEM